MVEKVWVGKKVQIMSLEELEKNHYKDIAGYFIDYRSFAEWFNSSISPEVRDVVGKVCEVCEVSEITATWFKLKEDRYNRYWELWMVKEPVSIQDVLESE